MALSIDSENLDALQCMGNLRMLRGKDEEAFPLLNRVVNKIVFLQDQLAEQTQIQNIDKNSPEEPLPSIQFRMQTARFLNELQKHKQVIKVLETVVQEDDETVEAWYLLAFSFVSLKKYVNAEECCKNVKNLIIKFKILDPELEAGTREIYEQV